MKFTFIECNFFTFIAFIKSAFHKECIKSTLAKNTSVDALFGISCPLTNPLNNELCPQFHAASKSVTLTAIQQLYHSLEPIGDIKTEADV